jgi:hypothetical protein
VKRATKIGFAIVLLSLLHAAGGHAKVTGICAGWVPNNSTYCAAATPSLDIRTTTSPNPSFPARTIFLVVGNDSQGTIIYKTSLTPGVEDLLLIPEPMSLVLFGTGLLGIAMFIRWRVRKTPS